MRVGEAADFAVAEAVVGQFEDAAGDGDGRDVFPASGCDAVVGVVEGPGFADGGVGCLDEGPSEVDASLFADVSDPGGAV